MNEFAKPDEFNRSPESDLEAGQKRIECRAFL
jgi:hypothetical protein